MHLVIFGQGDDTVDVMNMFRLKSVRKNVQVQFSKYSFQDEVFDAPNDKGFATIVEIFCQK